MYDGRLITTCLICIHTCHDHCYVGDEEKYNCASMDRSNGLYNAHCVACKGKCHWKQHKNLPYYETSAKTGHNVNEIYKGIAELLLANKTDEEIKEQFEKISSTLSISSDNEESSKTKKKKKCC